MALCLPAMSLMPPDRLWAAIVPCGARMTCLGRRASPSSAFRSQGLFRTADVKRYTRRLLLVACISETPLSGLFAERENRTTEMLRGPALYLRLDLRQIFCSSAAAIRESRKSGWAMETSISARSQVERPARFTAPYSVTM